LLGAAKLFGVGEQRFPKRRLVSGHIVPPGGRRGAHALHHSGAGSGSQAPHHVDRRSSAQPGPEQTLHHERSPLPNRPRTARENAAILISGRPTVAATSEVMAETFWDVSAAAVVTVSTFASWVLVIAMVR